MKAKKFLQKIQLKNKQRIINKQFQKEGLTDDVLEAQIKLNQFKHENDITDSNEIVYKEYVQ